MPMPRQPLPRAPFARGALCALASVAAVAAVAVVGCGSSAGAGATGGDGGGGDGTGGVNTPANPGGSAPAAPTGLSAIATSAAAVELAWNAADAAAGVVKYQVFRDGGSTPLAETTGASWTDTTAVPLTAYTYQVVALDAAGRASEPSSPAATTTGFRHPGIIVGDALVEEVKAHLAAGEEPWTTALARVKADKLAKKSWVAKPVAAVGCGKDGDTTVDEGCTDEQNDAQAAYTQALLYRLTGDKAYGLTAMAILDAWSSTLTSRKFDKGVYKNAALYTAWVGEVFPKAAELVRRSDLGWPEASAKRFGDMLSNLYLPLVENGWLGFAANWELSFAEATMNIGLYNDDVASFQKGLANWRAAMKSSVYLASDGAMPIIPANRDVTTANLNARWHSPTGYSEGQEQETCRDLGHMAMGLGAALNAAETAWLQGLDLYGEERARLVGAMEFNLRFYNITTFPESGSGACADPTVDCEQVPGQWIAGADPSGWTCPALPRRGGGAVKLSFEIGYHHYAGREHLSLPETRKLLAVSRPSLSGLHLNWMTLTHGTAL